MDRILFSGNEAIARGAYEAGVKVCSAYPGTPSTEVFEALPQYRDSLYCEWAPNEKVATEVAYGASLAGVRSLCAMKHVGVNVAADPIFTAAYNGVGGGFVIVSADDPSMHSSQNEQDNRHYARAAKLAMVEPSDSQECLDFMREAYRISEQFDIPVLFRTTTRVAHSKSIVTFGEREEQEAKPYARNTRKNIASPANAFLNHPKLEKTLEALEAYGCTSPLNRMELNGTKVGVISASIAYEYAKDAFPADTSFLKLGLTNPLPMDLIRSFAEKVEKLYIIEELDDFMESQIRAAGIACEGKSLTGKLYELNPQLLKERIFGRKAETVDVGVSAVSRPPALCPGCPHRGFFYTMSRHKDFVISGDIGCYTLGNAKPLNAVDTCLCMGAGITVAQGFSVVEPGKKALSFVGDSTFFASGMTGIANAVYNQHDITVCVLDNATTAMTGSQPHPGTGVTLMGPKSEPISIEAVLRALGVKVITHANPLRLDEAREAAREAIYYDGPSAIIFESPCVKLIKPGAPVRYCEEACTGCGKCVLKIGCPALSWDAENRRPVVDASLCNGCGLCTYLCEDGALECDGNEGSAQ